MNTTPTGSLAAVLGRLVWMMVGPLALVLTLYYVVTSGTGWRTGADVLYFVILLAMIVGKWIEFRGGDPRTSSGEPVKPGDLRRYILMTLVLGTILWAVANLVGNHLLGK